MQRSGEARVGIDRLLVSLTGQVELKMLRKPGSSVNKGEEISQIIRDGKRLTILSPVSGTVTGLNNALHDDPSLLQEDPYGAGWLLSVKPSNWMAEVAVFHLADDATAWLKKELERIRDFLALSAGRVSPRPGEIYMQDGGALAEQALASMPEEVWNDFQKEILK